MTMIGDNSIYDHNDILPPCAYCYFLHHYTVIFLVSVKDHCFKPFYAHMKRINCTYLPVWQLSLNNSFHTLFCYFSVIPSPFVPQNYHSRGALQVPTCNLRCFGRFFAVSYYYHTGQVCFYATELAHGLLGRVMFGADWAGRVCGVITDLAQKGQREQGKERKWERG